MAVRDIEPRPPIPTVVTSAFGRVFYGANSRVYFSPLIRNISDIGRCYQRNDPTSDDISDILGTDGGVIYLDDATDIIKMVRFRESLIVLARNGVWAISGTDSGFSATGYSMSRVSYRGCIAKDSVVVGESSVLYFSQDGIIQLGYNEYGTIQDTDITETRIRSFYLEYFSPYDTAGGYDPQSKKVWWWHKDSYTNPWSEDPSPTPMGLVLDTTTGAFCPQQAAGDYKFAKPMVKDQEFWHIRHDAGSVGGQLRIGVSFQTPTSTTFRDQGVLAAVYSEYSAFLQSGPEALQKPGNSKGVVEASFFFQRTETQVTGFTPGHTEVDGQGNIFSVPGKYTYDYPSSCHLITKWDFDDTRFGNKWVGDSPDYQGTQKGQSDYRQIYDPNIRGFIPTDYPSDLNDGYSVVSKRMRLRGSGRAVSFVFCAEKGKDMQLLGYSVAYTLKSRL